ncbi:hypothetical protein J437_LFUL002826 [Ladona fulva]|uniref:Uncharacterized protein n=1 Tax=Ladona fulva TaxID=123851 RepID=A0A8K0K2T4_LADFU|nr:hypothetical protein J437_LFUL002826 [Ladona fulva]
MCSALAEFGLETVKLVGQGCDGVTVISGILRGAQASAKSSIWTLFVPPVFQTTLPLSKHLQTPNLDLNLAVNLAVNLQTMRQNVERCFSSVNAKISEKCMGDI